MRPRVSPAFWTLLILLVPWFSAVAIGALFGAAKIISTDPPATLIAGVGCSFLLFLIVLLLSGLRVRVCVHPNDRTLSIPFWTRTDSVKPGPWTALLLVVQSLFSKQRTLLEKDLRSLFVCPPDDLHLYARYYHPSSVAWAIIDYRAQLFAHPPFWTAPFIPGMKPIIAPDLVIAVETATGELLLRSLYSLKSDEVWDLAAMARLSKLTTVLPPADDTSVAKVQKVPH